MKLMLFYLLIIPFANATLIGDIPSDFVDIRKYIPEIKLDIRYFTKNNFIGEEIRGYILPKCLLQRHVAQDLSKVQSELMKKI